MRFFNTAGPINPKDHYYVPHRLNEATIRQLIAEKKYFTLHTPCQGGKTTAINIVVNRLNAEGNFHALSINVKTAQIASNDVNKDLKDVIEQAKKTLLSHQNIHTDVLYNRLQEPRIRTIIDSLLRGDSEKNHFPLNDLEYIRDLGLVTQRGIAIANPIYQEIIPNALNL